MFEVLPDSIGGDTDKELSENLRYPSQRRYGKERNLLPPLAVKLKLKNMAEFEKVQRHLEQLKCIGIDTKADHNCAIHAVTLQVKLPNIAQMIQFGTSWRNTWWKITSTIIQRCVNI